MKPENNGRKLESKLSACQPPVDVFDVAVWLALTGIFSSKLFSTVSFHTSTQTYDGTGCLVSILEAYSFVVKETQASCSFEQATHSPHSSRQLPLWVQYFSISGGVSALSPQCAILPHQESRLKASADFLLPKDEGNTKITLWLRNDTMPLLLLEPCS